MRLRRAVALATAIASSLVLVSVATAGPSGSRASKAMAITPAPAFSDTELTAFPSGDDWLTNGGDIYNRRYSPLNQINTSNVANLRGAWHRHLDSGFAPKYSQEATPVVYNGVIYVPSGNNDVFAIDGQTGEIIWAYKSGINQRISTICCGWDSRGVAIGDGKVYSAQLDGWLIAIDMVTGQQVWRTRNVLWEEGYTMTMAPQYVRGKVLVGMSGGEFGARGSLTAYDARTGNRLWRFYTCPQPGEFGGATWAPGEWQTCGSTIWNTPAVDPVLNMAYFSTSNADPWASRGPGMNLFSASIVAVDLDTGEYRWHFQQVHHDLWDYDCPSPVVLFDVVVNGVLRQAAAEACKTGWVYIVDRATGVPLIGIPERKVPQNRQQNTWPTQPIPIGDAFATQCPPRRAYAGRKGPDGKPFRIGCIYTPISTDRFTAVAPSALGGNNWPPMSFSPLTSYSYVCSSESHMAIKAVVNPFRTYQGGQSFVGVQFGGFGTTGGTFTAMDMRTNRKVWQKRWSGSCYSGSMTTGGNLVFVGRNNGDLQAYNATTGDRLWSFRMDAGANAPAVTYQIAGKQYVAILAGGNAFASPRNKGDGMWAFTLDGSIASGTHARHRR